jgi:hypothetical protein
MAIIVRYRDDDGSEPRLCERAILTSGTKCTAAIVLCDENGKRHSLCLPASEWQSRLARKRRYRVGYGRLYERLGVCWLAHASGDARVNPWLTISDSWVV